MGVLVRAYTRMSTRHKDRQYRKSGAMYKRGARKTRLKQSRYRVRLCALGVPLGVGDAGVCGEEVVDRLRGAQGLVLLGQQGLCPNLRHEPEAEIASRSRLQLSAWPGSGVP